jgi:MOSC domain-containing protein YiiM
LIPEHSPQVVSINISQVKTIQMNGKSIRTGILKTPYDGRLRLEGVNLRGDEQGDRRVHGGPERAAYAYALEDYLWWQDRLGRSIPHGRFGENFTLSGVDVSNALIGERWHIGNAVVQVTSPRVPCYKLGYVMNDQKFVKRFADALRPGAYLGIIQEGDVGPGDAVEVIYKPDHNLTVKEMTRIYLFDHDRVGEMLVPGLPTGWRDWVKTETAPPEV